MARGSLRRRGSSFTATNETSCTWPAGEASGSFESDGGSLYSWVRLVVAMATVSSNSPSGFSPSITEPLYISIMLYSIKYSVDELMDDRAERPGARVWSPRPSPGQLGMSQEGPDWATERERNTENLKPGLLALPTYSMKPIAMYNSTILIYINW